jgi:hypothetical protein
MLDQSGSFVIPSARGEYLHIVTSGQEGPHIGRIVHTKSEV